MTASGMHDCSLSDCLAYGGCGQRKCKSSPYQYSNTKVCSITGLYQQSYPIYDPKIEVGKISGNQRKSKSQIHLFNLLAKNILISLPDNLKLFNTYDKVQNNLSNKKTNNPNRIIENSRFPFDIVKKTDLEFSCDQDYIQTTENKDHLFIMEELDSDSDSSI